MKLSPLELTLIAGVFTVLGGVIVAWFSHRFSERINDRERFLNSYNAFRETFAPAIRELENTEKIHVEIILSEYPRHEAAMYVFIHNLHDSTITRFKTKWTEYKEAHEHYKKYRGFINSFKTMAESEEMHYRRKLLKLIYEILAIAKKY